MVEEQRSLTTDQSSMQQAAGSTATAQTLLPVPPCSLLKPLALWGCFGSPACPGQLMGYDLQEGTLNRTMTGKRGVCYSISSTAVAGTLNWY